MKTTITGLVDTQCDDTDMSKLTNWLIITSKNTKIKEIKIELIGE